MPFLENVTRGRDIPPERLRAVAAQYERFGGVSPINGQNRALVAALDDALVAAGHALPVYWGNRNWHPYLVDAVRQMRDDGVERALAFVTSGFSSYSSCRQYLEDIEAARAAGRPRSAGDRQASPVLRPPWLRRSVRSIARGGVRRADADAARRRSRRVHRAQPPDRDGREHPTTSRSSVRPRDSSPSAVHRGSRGRSCTRAAAARRRSPGSSPTSATTSMRSRRARARGRRRADRVRVRPHGGHQRPRCRRGEAGRSGGHRASSERRLRGSTPSSCRWCESSSRSVSIRRYRAERWVRWACARTCARAAASDRYRTATSASRTASSPRPSRSSSMSAADGRRSSSRHARSRARTTSGSLMSIGASRRRRRADHVEAPSAGEPEPGDMRMETTLDRGTAHEARRLRTDSSTTGTTRWSRAPRAGRLRVAREVFFRDRSVELRTERVERRRLARRGPCPRAIRAALPVRAERRNRRDHPTSAHTAQFASARGTRRGGTCSSVSSTVTTSNESLGNGSRFVRSARRTKGRAARGACAIAQRLASTPSASTSSSRSASTTKPCAHPASSTRPAGKKRHSRYATTSAFDVARVYCSYPDRPPRDSGSRPRP